MVKCVSRLTAGEKNLKN